jgi:tetratricopeptide (TPR) repeat protein
MYRTSCVLIALILLGASAFADEDAKTLFTRGRTQYALGHFKEAADLFEKAFELKQDPAILYNAAQAHRLAGDKKQALVLYQNYLRLFGEIENHEEVERRITELKAAIEAEQKANTNPPTGLLGDKGEAPPPAVAPSPTEPEPAPAAVVTQTAPEKPRPKRAWVWGVVAGGVVVVGAAVALGVVFGTTHKDPAASLGAVQAN